MARSKTTTVVEYPAAEFNQLVQEMMFPNKEVKVSYVIEEVGGDLLDRYPGKKTVTKVRVTCDGRLLDEAAPKRTQRAEETLARIKEHIDSGNSYEDCVNYAWHTIKAYEDGRDA